MYELMDWKKYKARMGETEKLSDLARRILADAAIKWVGEISVTVPSESVESLVCEMRPFVSCAEDICVENDGSNSAVLKMKNVLKGIISPGHRRFIAGNGPPTYQWSFEILVHMFFGIGLIDDLKNDWYRRTFVISDIYFCISKLGFRNELNAWAVQFVNRKELPSSDIAKNDFLNLTAYTAWVEFIVKERGWIAKVTRQILAEAVFKGKASKTFPDLKTVEKSLWFLAGEMTRFVSDETDIHTEEGSGGGLIEVKNVLKDIFLFDVPTVFPMMTPLQRRFFEVFVYVLFVAEPPDSWKTDWANQHYEGLDTIYTWMENRNLGTFLTSWMQEKDLGEFLSTWGRRTANQRLADRNPLIWK